MSTVLELQMRYMHAFVCACMHSCVRACIRVCVCACVRACVRVAAVDWAHCRQPDWFLADVSTLQPALAHRNDLYCC